MRATEEDISLPDFAEKDDFLSARPLFLGDYTSSPSYSPTTRLTFDLLIAGESATMRDMSFQHFGHDHADTASICRKNARSQGCLS